MQVAEQKKTTKPKPKPTPKKKAETKTFFLAEDGTLQEVNSAMKEEVAKNAGQFIEVPVPQESKYPSSAPFLEFLAKREKKNKNVSKPLEVVTVDAFHLDILTVVDVEQKENKKEGLRVVRGVADSGASAHLSGDKSLFSSFTGKKISLRVADRVLPQEAEWAIFRPNSLGLKIGLYHPDAHCLLLSTGTLEDEGMVVHLKTDNRFLLDGSGQRHELFRRNNSKLPLADVHFWDYEEEDEEELYCPTVDEEMGLLTASEEQKLLRHYRAGHFHIDGLNVNCPACIMAKGRGVGHKNQRPEHLKCVRFLQCVDWDFVGPFPESYHGNRFALNGVDQYTGWPECYPVPYKDDAGEKLQKFCAEVGRPESVRADNEPTFKGADSDWRKVCAKQTPPVIPYFSPPYSPAENGIVERWNQTSQNAMKANLFGVDPRMWDWCYKYTAYVYARLPRKSNKDTPYYKRFGRDASTTYFRRFGCLAYSKIHTEVGKLDMKWERGIFLGYSNLNSTYLIGVWRSNKNCASGVRFTVVENRVAKFDEDIIIGNIDDLQKFSTGTVVPFSLPSSLCDSFAPTDDSVAPSGISSPDCGAPSATGDECSSSDDKAAPAVQSTNNEQSSPGVEEPFTQVLSGNSNSLQDPAAVERPSSGEAAASPDGSAKAHDVGKIIKGKRGRPKGLKRQAHWKKPGPKSKASTEEVSRGGAKKAKRRKKATHQESPSRGTDEVGFAALETILEEAYASYRGDLEEGAKFSETDFATEVEAAMSMYAELHGEESIAFQVQVCAREALNGPDAAKFIEADTLERTQLESAKCWRPLEDGELTRDDEIIPAVVIYTKKRCGRYKARLVALGNRQKQVSAHEIFSPTISAAANRYVLVESAASAHHQRQFDISNAFIRAALDDMKVIIRLPKHWSKSPKGDLVRLVKSLYGLRIAPRKWFDCFRKGLEELGWVMCEREPGLFRKPSVAVAGEQMLMAIYVDDSLLTGPDAAECDAQMQKVLDMFPGKVIAPEMEGDVEVRDVIGMTVRYLREKRWLKMSMDAATERMAKKYNLDNAKPRATPCSPGDLTAGPKQENFPLRSLVGALQYIATQCRPDTTFATQRVARAQTSQTEAAVKAGKRVVSYLMGTKDRGLEYSPEIEKAFRSEFEAIAKQGKGLTGYGCLFRCGLCRVFRHLAKHIWKCNLSQRCPYCMGMQETERKSIVYMRERLCGSL